MISRKKSMSIWALCGAVIIAIWLGGVLAMGRLLYSSESLFYGWLRWISVFNTVGLFEYAGVEGMEDAVIDSLAVIWFPFSAWLAWRLNCFLKNRFNSIAEVYE